MHQKFCEHGKNTKIYQKIEELKTNLEQKELIDLDLWIKSYGRSKFLVKSELKQKIENLAEGHVKGVFSEYAST